MTLSYARKVDVVHFKKGTKNKFSKLSLEHLSPWRTVRVSPKIMLKFSAETAETK